MTVEPRPRNVENPFGVSSHEEYRAARVVASAATDATDCAMLLAALGISAEVRLAFEDQPADPTGPHRVARLGSRPW